MKTCNRFLITLSVSVFLASCSGKNEKAAPGTAPAAPQPYPVFEVAAQSATLDSEYPATLEGMENVDIRPKIDGFIEKIGVDEGAVVKKGQLLFVIHAPQYEQQVRTASAAVNSAEADVNAAQLQVNKTKPLVDKEIISRYELESAQLTLQSKKAMLAQAHAALVNAKVNLGYTRITSPVDGIIGAIPFKTGSLVSGNSAQPLTTVSNTRKVYAYFSLNEKQLLDFSNTYKGNTLNEQMKNIPPVGLILADGSIYPEKGKIESINSQVNKATGAVLLRATFPNPAFQLKTGASARVRIGRHMDNVILIPQKSTVDLQGKKFVYVLGDSAKVVHQEIQISDIPDGKFYVVTEGLKAGDKVVLEGFQSLRDGVKIKPQTLRTDSIYDAIKK